MTRIEEPDEYFIPRNTEIYNEVVKAIKDCGDDLRIRKPAKRILMRPYHDFIKYITAKCLPLGEDNASEVLSIAFAIIESYQKAPTKHYPSHILPHMRRSNSGNEDS